MLRINRLFGRPFLGFFTIFPFNWLIFFDSLDFPHSLIRLISLHPLILHILSLTCLIFSLHSPIYELFHLSIWPTRFPYLFLSSSLALLVSIFLPSLSFLIQSINLSLSVFFPLKCQLLSFPLSSSFSRFKPLAIDQCALCLCEIVSFASLRLWPLWPFKIYFYLFVLFSINC